MFRVFLASEPPHAEVMRLLAILTRLNLPYLGY